MLMNLNAQSLSLELGGRLNESVKLHLKPRHSTVDSMLWEGKVKMESEKAQCVLGLSFNFIPLVYFLRSSTISTLIPNPYAETIVLFSHFKELLTGKIKA